MATHLGYDLRRCRKTHQYLLTSPIPLDQYPDLREEFERKSRLIKTRRRTNQDKRRSIEEIRIRCRNNETKD